MHCSGTQVDSAVRWMLLLIKSRHRSLVGQLPELINHLEHIQPCEPPGISTILGRHPVLESHDEYQAVQPDVSAANRFEPLECRFHTHISGSTLALVTKA
ncbi:MAG: hypothetical protein JWM11_569 [Planctomycetaceae bacterium]|nr:hypothetical protein [Planctomycetaceae bacterium]